MARLIIKDITEEKLKHIFNAERHLNEAGIHFDRGCDIENGKPVTRVWELDYSLKGAEIIQ